MFPPEAPHTCHAGSSQGARLGNSALNVAFDSCFRPLGAGSLTVLCKNKKTCNLVLVDELQAGLADGDIYFSVYLKEVWFKIVSIDLSYLLCVSLCVCVCVCVIRVNLLFQRFQLSDHYGEGAVARPLAPRCLAKCLEGPKEIRTRGGVPFLPSSHPTSFCGQGMSSCLRVKKLAAFEGHSPVFVIEISSFQ